VDGPGGLTGDRVPMADVERASPRRLQLEVVVLIGLAVALLLPAGFFFERVIATRIIDARVADLRGSIASATAALAARIGRLEARTLRLAELVSRDLGSVPDAAAEFDRLTERDSSGARRSRRGLVDPTREAVIWTPPGYPDDPVRKAFLARAKGAVEQLGAGSLDDVFEDAWLLTQDNAEVVFIPGTPDYLDRPAAPDYRATPWLSLTRPDQNPSGRPRWTPPTRGGSPAVWYASLVAPAALRGAWHGSVGIDITFAPLLRELARLPSLSGVAHLVVDSTGLVLSAIGLDDLVRAAGDSLRVASLPGGIGDTLAAVLAAEARVPVRSAAVGDTLVFVGRLAGTTWSLASIVPRAAVLVPIAAPLRLLRVVVLAVFLVFSIATAAVVARDARRRREAEAAVQRGQERFLRLFHLLPVGVTLTRVSDGRMIEVNDTACQLAGFSRDEMVGRTTVEMQFWVEPEVRQEILGTVQREGSVLERPVKLRMRDRVVDVAFTARLLEVGGEQLLLSVFRDLSDQRRLEAQLLQAQKLEAVGRLAGGVAHDFNNLMTAVTGYAELVGQSLPPDDPRVHDVEEILGAARRGAALTKQLLGFSRQQIVQPRLVDLNGLVRGLERLLRPLIGEDVVLETRLDPGLGPVLIDPGQAEQVVTNFAVNARDAMPRGGTLTIVTRADGARVVLEVRDTGSGISDEVRPHLFEPFFTTKPPGHGSGLGLATCYGIVRQAGGTIEVDTELGVGSTFRVLLPRATGVVAPPEPAGEARSAEARTRRRILVVEDEEQVRRILERVLGGAGMEVISVANGLEALRFLEQPGQAVDLVISDVVMPEMGGRALAERVAVLAPSLPIVFISGHSDDRILRDDIAAWGHDFLAKPFAATDLLATVDRILTQGRA